jgi:exopolyphosphatase/guanosine-5'-triphosphate,3'-diphosphate pyrophosphatase
MTIHQQIAAGIDLGSNTFRLLVANCASGNFKVLTKKMVTVRLGRGLENTGLLHEDAMLKGSEVLHTFRKILDHYKPTSIRVCGTEALRQAQNSQIFLHRAKGILQQSIDILNGEEEARLSLVGTLSGYRGPLSSPLLLVDVGGGSTELIFSTPSTGETRIKSLGLGVVGLTEKYVTSSEPDIDHMDSLLTETILSACDKLDFLTRQQPFLIIGCGGTATSMAALDLNLTSYNESLVHGHILQRASIEKLWSQLIALPAGIRNALPCLGMGRGEIMPAGIRIYYILLKLLQQERMRVSDTGLLEGILLSSLPHPPA